MERHKTKTCDISFKSIRSDKLKIHKERGGHLKRNMERYEQENEDNVSTNGQ